MEKWRKWLIPSPIEKTQIYKRTGRLSEIITHSVNDACNCTAQKLKRNHVHDQTESKCGTRRLSLMLIEARCVVSIGVIFLRATDVFAIFKFNRFDMLSWSPGSQISRFLLLFIVDVVDKKILHQIFVHLWKRPMLVARLYTQLFQNLLLNFRWHFNWNFITLIRDR